MSYDPYYDPHSDIMYNYEFNEKKRKSDMTNNSQIRFELRQYNRVLKKYRNTCSLIIKRRVNFTKVQTLRKQCHFELKNSEN